MKNAILPGLQTEKSQNRKPINKAPARILHRPKKRSCPSLNRRTCSKVRRQSAGDKKGDKPSITKTSASASQNVSLSNFNFCSCYFLPCAVGAVAAAVPRSALKNSELDGSTTITSDFLLKLAL